MTKSDLRIELERINEEHMLLENDRFLEYELECTIVKMIDLHHLQHAQ